MFLIFLGFILDLFKILATILQQPKKKQDLSIKPTIPINLSRK